jgi:hypothetical protein
MTKEDWLWHKWWKGLYHKMEWKKLDILHVYKPIKLYGTSISFVEQSNGTISLEPIKESM